MCKEAGPSMCTFKSFQALTGCPQVHSEAGVPQMAPEHLLLEGVWAERQWGSSAPEWAQPLSCPLPPPTTKSGARSGISQTVVHLTSWA